MKRVIEMSIEDKRLKNSIIKIIKLYKTMV